MKLKSLCTLLSAALLCACKPSTNAADEAAMRAEISKNWSDLSKIYSDQNQKTEDIAALNDAVVADIDRQTDADVRIAELRVQLLLAQYQSNQGIYATTGAGLAAQYAQEDLIRKARFDVLKARIKGQERKLPFLDALQKIKRHTQHPACLDADLPTETEKTYYANCVVVFGDIERDQRSYVGLVATSRTVAVKTTEIFQYFERSHERQKRFLATYNDAVEKYQTAVRLKPIEKGVVAYSPLSLPLNAPKADQATSLIPKIKVVEPGGRPKAIVGSAARARPSTSPPSLETGGMEGYEPEEEVADPVDNRETPAQIRLRNTPADSDSNLSN